MFERIETPEPLEILTRDYIDSDNEKVLSSEQNRYRILTWAERLKMELYVWRLGGELRRSGWNRLVSEYDELKRRHEEAVDLYHRTTYISDDARAAARDEIKKIAHQAGQVLEALRPHKATYSSYNHFSGWLTYERNHRAELRREQRIEKKTREKMRIEARWLEKIMLDVFRGTAGCHYIKKDHETGKEVVKIPRFDRTVIMPDAHYYYLATSRKTIFGWKWLLPHDVNISRLTDEEVIANMRAATRHQVDAIWSNKGQLMYRVSRLDSPDALPKLVRWSEAMKYYPTAKGQKFPYTIGASENRKLKWFYLTDEPHILVGGKTKSGKSNLVNGIIGTMVTTHSPDELRVLLIDQKGGLEFGHWNRLPHLLGKPVTELEEVRPALTNMVTTMRKRFDLMARVNAKDIDAYNKRVDQEYRLPFVVIIIDEMNTFLGLGRETQEIHQLINLIGSQGRAVGLHLILSTQHPEVKVIPGRIKTNMSVRMSGPMPSVTASEIVLDNSAAAYLPSIPGRFVAVCGLDQLTVQVPLITDDDIAGIISATREAYPEVNDKLPEAPPALPVWDETNVMTHCIDFLEGQLSAQKLHEFLEEESPGERHLKKVVNRLRERAEAAGGYLEDKDGHLWRLRKIRRSYHLELKSDQADQADNKTPAIGQADSSD